MPRSNLITAGTPIERVGLLLLAGACFLLLALAFHWNVTERPFVYLKHTEWRQSFGEFWRELTRGRSYTSLALWAVGLLVGGGFLRSGLASTLIHWVKHGARENLPQQAGSSLSRQTLGHYEGQTMRHLYAAIIGEENRIYYLTKFEQFDQQGTGLKASWNWPAFLCTGVWMLYRKMYGWFFAFWGLIILSSTFEKAGAPGLGAIIFIGTWIAFTIYANSLYHNSVKKKIAVGQLSVKEEPKLLEFLRHKGGVHTWVIWVFGLLLVIGILAAVLIPMFARH